MKHLGQIPAGFAGTAIEKLVRYHNFLEPAAAYLHPELLVCMCMDYRINLALPPGFAYVLRTAGCNISRHHFQVAYAVAVGGVKAIALIGHTDCGMVTLPAKREKFIQGLTGSLGWKQEEAEQFFDRYAPENTICNETEQLFKEAKLFRAWFPSLPVAVLIYQVEDGMLVFPGSNDDF